MIDERSSHDSRPCFHASRIDALVAVFAMFLLAGVSWQIDRVMADLNWQGYDEHHYQSEMINQRPALWVEFARDRDIRLVDDPDILVALTGFEESRFWLRTIGWARLANKTATVTIYYPPNKNVTRLGLFLTDGDNLGRVMVIRHESGHKITEPGENGSWVYLDISEEERRLGEKKVTLKNIASNIALTALAVMAGDL